jgi:hypothetical protein
MSNQPQQALVSLLNPQQLQLFNQINSKPDEEKAAAIAKMCNERGISKEQLAQMFSLINGNKSVEMVVNDDYTDEEIKLINDFCIMLKERRVKNG